MNKTWHFVMDNGKILNLVSAKAFYIINNVFIQKTATFFCFVFRKTNSSWLIFLKFYRSMIQTKLILHTKIQGGFKKIILL